METRKNYIIFGILIVHINSILGLWDFAVTVKSKIIFYDEHWREITSSAHQFDHLLSTTFDEVEEIIYFSDRLHNDSSIFSLKIPTTQEDDTAAHAIEKIVKRTRDELITSMAYDPLNRNLYWIDQKNRKILFQSIDAKSTDRPKILIDFIYEDTIPDGIAIDICRRKLYWTNSNFKNASIERIDLNGSDREVLVNTDLYLPHGIVIDQLSDRLYWVVDQQGMHYTVESSNLDGSDRYIIVKGLDSTPTNLAVTNDIIYWTDQRHNALWMQLKRHHHQANMLKNQTDTFGEFDTPRLVLKFIEQPSCVLARTRYMTNLQNDNQCSVVISKIKKRLLLARQPEYQSGIKQKLQSMTWQQNYCLNGGEYIQQSGICICQIGFKGARCETNECHNYCVHGTCSMSSMGFPKCSCQHGFHGDRCQSYKCSGYCFNNGICKIENNGEASCECEYNYGGQRCEQNSTEICALFCRLLKHETDIIIPYGCYDICQELAADNEETNLLYAIPSFRQIDVCQGHIIWTNTLIIILMAGIIVCLFLILIIVYTIRRFYKPARPRIKKTFVVRKQQALSTDTPLTNRPIATQQCEITIENCCNMNYCDTPCFDPKLVQQSLSCDAHIKEDKKMLIHNMEDELY